MNTKERIKIVRILKLQEKRKNRGNGKGKEILSALPQFIGNQEHQDLQLRIEEMLKVVINYLDATSIS